MSMIHDHDEQDVVPLVPQPLSDDYDRRHLFAEPTHDGRPDPADPTDLIQVWGHCADFCAVTDDARTDGLTVAEHGPWCQSRTAAAIDSQDAKTGQHLRLYAAVARSYLHGTYHRTADWYRLREEQVQLTLMDGDDVVRVVNVRVGDALRLAAGLTRACAVADLHDQDFQGKTRRQEGEPPTGSMRWTR
jgi:hypothetical protein